MEPIEFSKIAIITATRNSASTIRKALDSVARLPGEPVHIIVDGDSTDGTRDIVGEFVETRHRALLVDQSSTGLYEALNQGIGMAMEVPSVKYISLLHSDDQLVPTMFEAYVDAVVVSSCLVGYSDIEFRNSNDKVVRRWRSGRYSYLKWRMGWMPAHTGMVVSAQVYRDFGLYRTDFGTAADYEWFVRIAPMVADTMLYFPETTVAMGLGGASGSGIRARLEANKLDGEAWRDSGAVQRVCVRLLKPAQKLFQFRVPRQ